MEPIAASDLLYRRLHPNTVSRGVIESSAFNDDSGDVSVDLARLTTPEASVARAKGPGYGLAVIRAAIPLEEGLTVLPDPLPENPAHALIIGVRTRQQRRRLARAAELLIPPAPLTVADAPEES